VNVRVVSPDGVLWSGESTSVVIPSADGDMGVLAGHQPVLSVLRPGTAHVTLKDGTTKLFEIVSGLFSCNNDEIELLIDNTGHDFGA
jgi:F-type H+-transporting ATPase subunit epsilon